MEDNEKQIAKNILTKLYNYAVEAYQFEIKEYDDLEVFRQKYLNGFIKKLGDSADNILYYYSQQGKDYQEQLFKFSELLNTKYLLHSELFAIEALQRLKDGL